MKVLLQRVSEAEVKVEQQSIGKIGPGILALVGFGKGDDLSKLKPMADKLLNLRIFPDQRGRFDKSILDSAGAILLVPQFTLYADCSAGRRPDFFASLEPALAKDLFEKFVAQVKNSAIAQVQTGEFGAHMHVSLLNDGPVTIMLEL